MDARTDDFYRRYASGSLARDEASRSAISRHFETAFPPGARVLDVGAGSGRDLAALLALGHDAFGLEPNAAMRAVALRLHPALADRLAPGALPDVGQPFGGAFDAVVCSAVLMHLSPAELVAALRAFAAVLAPAGRVLLSIPTLPAASLRDGRDADQRRFTNHATETIAAEMRRLGFAPIGEWASKAGETWWTVQLFERA